MFNSLTVFVLSLFIGIITCVRQSNTGAWEKADGVNNPIAVRDQFFANEQPGILYAYGGHLQDHQEAKAVLNQLYALDVTDIRNPKGWRLLNSRCESSRYGGVMVYVEEFDQLWIWGGHDQYNVVSDGRVMKYDVKSDSWDYFKETETAPVPLYLAAHAIIGSDLYVFGGEDNNMGVNDVLYVFNGKENTWKSISLNAGPRGVSAGLGISFKGNFYVFGGTTFDNQNSGDLWKFNVKEETWEKPSLDPPIQGRYSSCGVVMLDNLFLFGGARGVFSLDPIFPTIDLISYKVGQALNITPTIPPVSSASICTRSINEDAFVIANGRGFRGQPSYLNDTWIFNILQ